MTPERAKEILQAGSRWCNWEKHCTEEEDRYIKNIWDHMPGYTCWYDALCRIAQGNVDGKIVWYNDCIRGVITDIDGETGQYGIRLENGNYVWAEKEKVSWRY